MRGHDRADLHQREEDYEHGDYDEYEDEAAESEEDIEQEPKPTKEEHEFLKLREQLKDKIRQNLKKQSASAYGHLTQTQDKKRTSTNDKFGSFFGPSQPVIAPRVLEESRSIRETRHIAAKVPSSNGGNKKGPVSTSTEMKTHIREQQQKVANEVKKKAQTLKDMRDYSFLLSDDADFPVPEKEPAPQKVSVSSSDARSAQAPLKSKISTSNSARMASNGHVLKNSVSSNRHVQTKAGSVKETPVSRPRPTSVEYRKLLGASVGNLPGRPVGHKTIPPKVPAQVIVAKKPPPAVLKDPSLKKNPSSIKSQPSTQKHYSEPKRLSQGLDKVKTMQKQPSSSSKPQPSKQIPSRAMYEGRPKKRPVKEYSDEEGGDDAEAINMIRQMFGYNPSKYAGVDDDDSDMEVGFDTIQKEEWRSSQIAREEDEEQLRLIEEEERRERLRKEKKRKLAQR